MSVSQSAPLSWPPSDIVISASLLAANPLCLLDEALEVQRAGVDWLHVDIMDGHFVPNLALSPGAAQALAAHQRLPVDVHLMVAEPNRYCEALAEAGASIITVHVEAVKHLDAQVAQLRALGVRVGVAINPATPIPQLEAILPQVDLVLLMTVDPGFGGQTFIPHMADKLRQLRLLRDHLAPACVLQVDGGITATWAHVAAKQGATAIVAGSAIFGKENRAAAVAQLRQAVLAGLKEA